MLIVFILLVLVCIALVLVSEHEDKEHTISKAVPPQDKIGELNTVLQNIEVYDGTTKGQKRIGGDGK